MILVQILVKDLFNMIKKIFFSSFLLIIEEFYKLKYCSTVVYMVPRA